MSKVPVYICIEGKAQMIQRLPSDEAEKLVTLRRLKPVRGRRGHLKACVVIERLTGLIHLERTGYCITQDLPTGPVYALVGARGSEI
jgi:hypothetical protein